MSQGLDGIGDNNETILLIRDFAVGYVLAFGAVLLLQLMLVAPDPEANSSNGFLVAFLAALYTGVKQSDRSKKAPGRWTLWLWSLYLTVIYLLMGFLFIAIYLYALNALLGLDVIAPPYLEKQAELLHLETLWLLPFIVVVAIALNRFGLGVGLWLGFRRQRNQQG
ncbi:MAG: ABZJ_00895 family protein [Kiloniellales bacterium]